MKKPTKNLSKNKTSKESRHIIKTTTIQRVTPRYNKNYQTKNSRQRVHLNDKFVVSNEMFEKQSNTVKDLIVAINVIYSQKNKIQEEFNKFNHNLNELRQETTQDALNVKKDHHKKYSKLILDFNNNKANQDKEIITLRKEYLKNIQENNLK